MEHSIADRERCAALVAALNSELGWHLEAEQQQSYVTALLRCSALPDAEDELRRVVIVFHQDHALVEALRDRASPAHDAAWTEWCAKAQRILRHHGLGAADEAQGDIQDLAQVVLEELLHALSSFRYASRFSTWAYAVISRSAQRHLRDLHAAKRRGPVASIEQLEALEVAALEANQPDTRVEARELAALIDAVLSDQPDQRWREIFRLWAHEDKRLAEIAERLGLSTSRVSILLDQITGLLRQHPAILAWISDDAAAENKHVGGDNPAQKKSQPD